jgi:hypothetical protein
MNIQLKRSFGGYDKGATGTVIGNCGRMPGGDYNYTVLMFDGKQIRISEKAMKKA